MRSGRWLRVVAYLLPLLLLPPFAGCSAKGSQTATPLAKDATYVALGDSYAAAPGIGPAFGQDGCFRTLKNYPHLVAKATGMKLADVSCSGANTKAVVGRQQTLTGKSVDAQVDALGPATEVVTIGIGGNDLGFYQEMTNVCVRLASTNRSGTPCADADSSHPQDQTLTSRLVQLQLRDVAVIRAIQDHAPNARVIVVGYPQIVPERTPCAEYPVAAGDLPYARRIVEGLNQALSSAAASTGVTYVDVYVATSGHDICSADPWIAGLRATRGASVPWHPYAAEQQAVADAVEAALKKD